MTGEEINQLSELVAPAFYTTWSFWISSLLGAAGVVFSVLAYVEARAAKIAAFEAGRTVKIQTITIELSEIAQRLDKLDSALSFPEARDLLNEVSRRLRRLIAPFQGTDDFAAPATSLKAVLDDAKSALETLRPQDAVDGVPSLSVYFGMQGHFSNISSMVAEIMGLFEKRTIEVNRK